MNKDVSRVGQNHSEDKYGKLLMAMPALVCELSPDGTTQFVNDAISKVAGYTPDELLGKDWWGILCPGEWHWQAEELQGKLESGPVDDYEMAILAKNGSPRFLNWRFSITYLPDGALESLMGFAVEVTGRGRDISELRRMEEELSSANRRLETYARVVDESPDLIAVIDQQYVYRMVNAKFLSVNAKLSGEVLGHTIPEVLGQSVFENTVRGFMDKALAGESVHYESWFETAPRGRRFWEVSYYPLMRDGNIEYVVVEGRDATERKKTADALQESERRYRDLVETSQDLIWECDLEGRFTYLNQSWEQTHGYKIEEMLGRKFTDFQTPEQAAKDKEVFESFFIRGAKSLGYETTHVSKSGEPIYLIFNARVLLDAEGNVIGTHGTANDLTERVKTERFIKESEEKYKNIVELTNDIIFVSDRNGNQTFMNDAAYRMLEITPEDIIGQQWIKLIHPDDREKTLAKFNEMVKKGIDTFDFENRYVSKSGKIIYGLNNVRVLRNMDGEVVGAQGSAKDITERKLTEEERDQLVEELRQLNEQLVVASLQARERAEEAEQRSAEISALLDSARSVLEYHDSKEAVLSIFRSCKNLVGAAEGLVVIPDDDGKNSDILLKDATGTVCLGDAYMQMSVHGLMPDLGAQSQATYFNDFQQSGLVTPMPAGHTQIDNLLVAPLTVKGQAPGVLCLANKPEGFNENDVRIVSAFGELIAIALYNSNMLVSLEDSEERFRYLAQTASDGIVSINSNVEIIFWNRGAEAIFGYSSEEVIGRPLTILIPERFAGSMLQGLRRIISTGDSKTYNPMIEVAGVRKDGNEFPAELSFATWITREGIFCTSIVRDITERKRLEEEILRAQRLETAGRIAGQVAHDFNNLLSPLAGYPELIKMELPENHPAAELCNTMLKAVEQMSSINADLMALGRRGHFNQEPLNLNRLVEQAVAQILDRSGFLTINLSLAEDLLPIKGSSAQLLRVLSNLVSNAREAIQDTGTLSIKTENVYLDKPSGSFNQLEIGEYVKLEVKDTGCGIPSEIKGRIFDAFFTTKTTGKSRGSGLGLSVVQAIVGDHSGYIDLETELGKGSVFSLYFPACREPVAEELSRGIVGGTETVLFVDDDEVQREVMSQLLAKLGYQVIALSDGLDAVSYLKGRPVDLVILDMIMPGLDGTETYRRVKEVRPGQKAIIVSGFAESERVREAQSLGAGAYIRKPVTLQSLARAIREELER